MSLPISIGKITLNTRHIAKPMLQECTCKMSGKHGSHYLINNAEQLSTTRSLLSLGVRGACGQVALQFAPGASSGVLRPAC